MQLDYDPEIISFAYLLELFWSSHRAQARPYSRQYMSLILCSSEQDVETARESKQKHEERHGSVHTEIRRLDNFYLAEGYHQKYYLRRVPMIFREVEERFRTLSDLLASPEVSRLNGYVAGYGTVQRLEADLSTLGLSERAADRLKEIVESR